MRLGGPRHGARVWCLGRVPKHRNQWKELQGLLFSPQNSQLVHILSFQSQAVVSLFIFPTGQIALDSQTRHTKPGHPGLVRSDSRRQNLIFFTNYNILHTLKNEPLNIMLVHTSRRMDGSRGLVIQPQKLSVGANFELSFLGCGFLIHLSNRSDSPRFSDPTHQTRAPWLGPLRLKKAKSNLFTNCNILHTLKKEPLNIMLLHTSRTMDGP